MQTRFDAGAGRTLSYSRRGAGPLVVCLPGGPGMDPDAYFAAMDLPRFELLVFAPRGTGDSTPPPQPEGYRIGGYVEDVESLRIHLGVQKLTIYGNSHGGCIALAYAARYPDRIARMVVTNAPPRMDDAYEQAVKDTQRHFAATFEDGGDRLASAEDAYELMNTDIEPGEWRRQYRIVMARYVAVSGAAETTFLDRLCAAPMNFDPVPVMYAEFVAGLDLLGGADRVSAAVLVVAGEFDVVVPPVAMRWIADALPAGRFHEFEGVGHFPEVEAGDEFTAVVTGFLAE